MGQQRTATITYLLKLTFMPLKSQRLSLNVYAPSRSPHFPGASWSVDRTIKVMAAEVRQWIMQGTHSRWKEKVLFHVWMFAVMRNSQLSTSAWRVIFHPVDVHCTFLSLSLICLLTILGNQSKHNPLAGLLSLSKKGFNIQYILLWVYTKYEHFRTLRGWQKTLATEWNGKRVSHYITYCKL